MAANIQPIFVESANVAEVTFVNADGTTPKDLVSAGADGTKIMRIAATTSDTSANNVALYVHDGTTAYLVGTVNVPTLSGTDGTNAAVNLLDTTALPWLDSDGEFFIPTGYKIQAGPIAAVTSGSYTLTIVCFAGDY
jgi:hypothetical protein